MSVTVRELELTVRVFLEKGMPESGVELVQAYLERVVERGLRYSTPFDVLVPTAVEVRRSDRVS